MAFASDVFKSFTWKGLFCSLGYLQPKISLEEMFNKKKIQGGQECPTKHNFASATMLCIYSLAWQMLVCWAVR